MIVSNRKKPQECHLLENILIIQTIQSITNIQVMVTDIQVMVNMRIQMMHVRQYVVCALQDINFCIFNTSNFEGIN